MKTFFIFCIAVAGLLGGSVATDITGTLDVVIVDHENGHASYETYVVPDNAQEGATHLDLSEFPGSRLPAPQSHVHLEGHFKNGKPDFAVTGTVIDETQHKRAPVSAPKHALPASPSIGNYYIKFEASMEPACGGTDNLLTCVYSASEQDVKDAMYADASTNFKDMYNEASDARLTFNVSDSTFHVVTVGAQPASNTAFAWRNLVLTYKDSGVPDPIDYDHYVFWVPDNWCGPGTTSCFFAYASVGGAYSVMSVSSSKCFSAAVHEIGHNLKLQHAAALDSSENYDEYADRSSSMGYSYAESIAKRGLNAINYLDLGFFYADNKKVHDGCPAEYALTALNEMNAENDLKMVELTMNNGTTLYFEYRKQQGYDAHLDTTGSYIPTGNVYDTILVHKFTEPTYSSNSRHTRLVAILAVGENLVVDFATITHMTAGYMTVVYSTYPTECQCTHASNCTTPPDVCRKVECINSECVYDVKCASPTHLCEASTGTCYTCQTNAECDDGLFCNGQETCDTGVTNGQCVAGSNACQTFETCDETNDVCISCNNDDVCNNQEDCNSCPNDCATGVDDYTVANDVCETGNGETCHNSVDCNGVTGGSPSNRYCCGDDADCNDSRCSGFGKTCETQVNMYCCTPADVGTDPRCGTVATTTAPPPSCDSTCTESTDRCPGCACAADSECESNDCPTNGPQSQRYICA